MKPNTEVYMPAMAIELGVDMKLTPRYILHRLAMVLNVLDVLTSLFFNSELFKCLSEKLDPEKLCHWSLGLMLLIKGYCCSSLFWPFYGGIINFIMKNNILYIIRW